MLTTYKSHRRTPPKLTMRASATAMQIKTKSCKVTGERKCRCDVDSKPIVSILTLQGLLRKLFTDHAVYTMFYLKSAIFGGPDASFLLNRLLENQTQIGLHLGALPAVGDELGKEIGDKLTEHIQAAGQVVAAAIAYFKSKTVATNTELTTKISALFAQGDEVAASFVKLNPHVIDLQNAKDAFHMHNQQVIDLATLLLSSKFEDEVRTYDAYYNHMLQIADVIFAALR